MEFIVHNGDASYELLKTPFTTLVKEWVSWHDDDSCIYGNNSLESLNLGKKALEESLAMVNESIEKLNNEG